MIRQRFASCVALLCCVSLSILIVPQSSGAAESHSASWQSGNLSVVVGSDELASAAKPYLRRLTIGSQSVVYIDLRAAHDAGEPMERLHEFATINDILGAGLIYGERFSMPVWGRYCGPGHSGPGDPIDLLDNACMHHDNCYNWGGNNCACDLALIKEIDTVFPRMAPPAQKMARIVRAAFVLKTMGC